MTIVGKDGNPIKGYFTRDSKPKYGTAYINKAIRDARKKYGKDAKFLSTSAVRSIYYKFVERNEKALDILVNLQNQMPGKKRLLRKKLLNRYKLKIMFYRQRLAANHCSR